MLWHNLRLFLFSFIHKSHVLSYFYFYLNAHFFIVRLNACIIIFISSFAGPTDVYYCSILGLPTFLFWMSHPWSCFFCFCFAFFYFLLFLSCFVLLTLYVFLFYMRSFTHFLSQLFALSLNSYRNWGILVFYVFYKNDFRE